MELSDLYTKKREKTGKTIVRGEVQPKGLYRLVVHVCVFDSDGKMLIQQRQPCKREWPDMWDLTVSGGVAFNEDTQQAAQRELNEELGLDISFENTSPNISIRCDKVFSDVYIAEKNIDITKLSLQKEEVKGVKWASKDEIFQMIDNGLFIPYNKSFIDLVFHFFTTDVIWVNYNK